MNDEQIRSRTVGRIMNALNQFKRELASDGIDTAKLTLEWVIDALANYNTPAPSDETETPRRTKRT